MSEQSSDAEMQQAEEVLSAMVARLQARHGAMHALWASPRLQRDLAVLHAHGDVVDGESLRYGTQKVEGIDAERFGLIFETVWEMAPAAGAQQRPSSFSDERRLFAGLTWRLLLGQGSSYQVWPTTEEDVAAAEAVDAEGGL